MCLTCNEFPQVQRALMRAVIEWEGIEEGLRTGTISESMIETAAEDMRERHLDANALLSELHPAPLRPLVI